MACGCGGDGGEGGYLNWRTSVRHVFFRWWNADTPTGFLTTNLLLFIFAFVFEGLLNYRARLDQQISYTRTSPILGDRKSPFTIAQNLIRSALHALSYYISQVLMMIFMAYNGYFCASLVMGRFAGHLFFSLYLPIEKDQIGERPKACCS